MQQASLLLPPPRQAVPCWLLLLLWAYACCCEKGLSVSVRGSLCVRDSGFCEGWLVSVSQVL